VIYRYRSTLQDKRNEGNSLWDDAYSELALYTANVFISRILCVRISELSVVSANVYLFHSFAFRFRSWKSALTLRTSNPDSTFYSWRFRYAETISMLAVCFSQILPYRFRFPATTLRCVYCRASIFDNSIPVLIGRAASFDLATGYYESWYKSLSNYVALHSLAI